MAAFRFTGPDGTVFEFDEELPPELLKEAVAGYYIVHGADEAQAAKPDASEDRPEAVKPGVA